VVPLHVLRELSISTPSKIVLVVLDGLGGFPDPATGRTELETAHTPHLDDLARRSNCGLAQAVAPGISPGSGPAHLALFGYDPIEHNVGRGILSALGIGFEVGPDDLCARMNFATIDERGIITDRRAGRISTEANRRLVEKLRAIKLPGVELFVETESGHRAAVIFRGPGLSDRLTDTDPQREGHPPLEVEPADDDPASRRSAELANEFVRQAAELLKNEHPANFVLLRGFARYPSIPKFTDTFKLKAGAIAVYPMYRGLARLVGMDVLEHGESLEDEVASLERHWGSYEFFFVHYKNTDTTGEDGNFTAKVAAIEQFDAVLPRIMALKPDVIAITGDHSTPSRLRSHSWHPVPLLVHSQWCIPDGPDGVDGFNERACRRGSLGWMPARQLMPLLMGHAHKLERYGA
jgi:2,3-bisphosphoglycerate-independent phosphoglycerate mutase